MLCYRTTNSANCKFYTWKSCFQFQPRSMSRGRGSTSGASEDLHGKGIGAVLKPKGCNASLELRHKAFPIFTGLHLLRLRHVCIFMSGNFSVFSAAMSSKIRLPAKKMKYGQMSMFVLLKRLQKEVKTRKHTNRDQR